MNHIEFLLNLERNYAEHVVNTTKHSMKWEKDGKSLGIRFAYMDMGNFVFPYRCIVDKDNEQINSFSYPQLEPFVEHLQVELDYHLQ